MSAAEKLHRTPRQRRRDDLVVAATQFAHRVADILDEMAISGGEANANDVQPRRRPAVKRAPYVPTHGQTPSPEAMKEAADQARRRGIR